MIKIGVGRRSLLVLCLGGMAVAGAWALWERRAGRVLTAAELLDTLPIASSPSPTDKAVWMLIGGIVATVVGLVLTLRPWKQA